MLYGNGGMAVLGVFPGAHIVGGVAVAKPFRENLIENRILHPFRLDVVGKQHEVIGVIRQVGGNLLLGAEIHHILEYQIKLVLHPVFRHLQGGFVVHKALLFLPPGHGDQPLHAVGDGAQKNMLHRRIPVEAQLDGDGFKELRAGIADKGSGAVTVDAFQPKRGVFSHVWILPSSQYIVPL